MMYILRSLSRKPGKLFCMYLILKRLIFNQWKNRKRERERDKGERGCTNVLEYVLGGGSICYGLGSKLCMG